VVHLESLDASLVAPRLYQGGKPPTGRLRGIHVLVLCAVEYQPRAELFPNVSVLHCPLDDGPFPISAREQRLALSTAKVVSRLLRHGHPVLSTCAMGLNRSGLISALAMCKAYKATPDQAIRNIRAARGPRALTNPSFEEFLRLSAGRF
jgi:protein-tyrosine phosphatase